MVNLDELKVADLKNLAKEFGIKLKQGKKDSLIKQIQKAKIDEKKLNAFVEKYQSSKKKQPLLEDRVGLLEEQVKFLINKVSDIDAKISTGNIKNFNNKNNNLEEIKNQIKKLIVPGNSMTIDEIMNNYSLKKIPFKILEQAIIDLIDDEVFDVSEGVSVRKIEGNIGRLIRR